MPSWLHLPRILHQAAAKNVHRAIAIALLLLLHVIVIVALLTTRIETPATSRGTQEIILSFTRPKPLPVEPQPSGKERTKRRVFLPMVAPLISRTLEQVPGMTGLGQALFGCAPENSANLSPEQLKACDRLAIAPPTAVQDAGIVRENEAHDEARWTAALAKRRAPARVPCVDTQQGPGGQGGATVMFDLVCSAKRLVNGFGNEK